MGDGRASTSANRLPATATLLSVNIGRPKDVAWQGKTVYTGIYKQSVPGPQMVRRLNIDGDGQGDTAGHGGENRAVFVYQIQSYDYWQEQLGRDDFIYGQFGENFTVSGLLDNEVCIGDRYRIGAAEFEVTQPRVTCYRVGLRMNVPEMPSLLVAHHRPGFYFRVITEGHVEAGDEIVKTTAGPEQISVADTDALLYLPDRDPAQLRRALQIPALSKGWRTSFEDLLDPNNAPSAPAATAEPAWAGFRQLRVVDIVHESSTISSIMLAADDGQQLPAALAGQFLTVRVPAGGGGPPAVRSYSLSSAPGASQYRISVKREPHGLVSGYLDSTLRAGATLDVAAPRGSFVLDDADAPVVLLSAGVGVTPVMAMLHELAAERSQREVWWIHTARSAAEQALAAEASALLAELPQAHEHVRYTSVAGRLTADDLAAFNLPPTASAFICGPAAFMATMRSALADTGLADEHIHVELFGALASITPGIAATAAVAPHAPTGPPGTGPEVTFSRSGLSVRWSDNRGNILELAEACDVPTRWSCRTGVCHTCVTALLAGSVTYSPQPLELPASGDVLICSAQPDQDVVVDL